MIGFGLELELPAAGAPYWWQLVNWIRYCVFGRFGCNEQRGSKPGDRLRNIFRKRWKAEATRQEKLWINKSRRLNKRTVSLLGDLCALGHISGHGSQSRKARDSSHVSIFICEPVACQHLYLAPGPVTVNPSPSAQPQLHRGPMACSSSLLPSSPSSRPPVSHVHTIGFIKSVLK